MEIRAFWYLFDDDHYKRGTIQRAGCPLDETNHSTYRVKILNQVILEHEIPNFPSIVYTQNYEESKYYQGLESKKEQ